MSQSLIEQFRAEDAANGYTPGQNVRPALEVAASTNADQQARSMQLAEELGLSREVVSEQREWAEQEATARRIERNPMFARWAELSDTNAAFARDDTEKMGDVFDILHEAELSAHGKSGAQVKADIVRGVLQYNARHGDKDAQVRLQREAGLTEEEIRNGTISQTPMPGTLVQLGESYLEGWQGVAKNAAGFMAMLGENMGTNIQTGEKTDWAPLWDAVAKSARDALEYADTAHSAPLNAQGFANDFVRNLPQVAATIALSAAGSPAVGTAFVGSQIAGGTYADLTHKHEVRMPTAAELEDGARMLARAAAQGWQGAVNNARMAAHEAGGEGGALYEGEEPDELAMASARARMIAAAILNTEQAVPAGTAALAALGNAAVQAPLEMVGFGKLFDVFKATGAGNLVRRIVESAATEFVTETIQQHPDEFARIWGKGTAKGEGWQDVWKQYTGQFWDITKEGMYAGALSAPFGLLGGIGKAATDVRMAQEAVDWAQAHVAFHAKVEETKAKKVAPSLVQQALEEGGMRDVAHVDGEALYQLAQEDPLVLQQLGLEEKAVQQAAEAGQTITLPMSKVHAQMQQEQLAKFMAISRREPDSWTAREAEVLPETLKQTAERAAEKVAADTEAARQAEIEIRRIREEIVQAVSSVPTLKARIQADGMSPEAYADNHLEIIVRLAKSLANESGGSIADFLRDQTYEGLDYDASGKLVPVSRLRDKERMEEERARAEADRPFWELVWGRVDPESLKTDYAETYKELRKSKRGLFMPAGRGGVPLDQIADELNERGIFTGSADDLLELLKTKERPRRGYYQSEGGSLYQMNDDVDLDREVSVVSVTPRFEGMAPRYARKNFPKDLRRAILHAFQEAHETKEGVKHGIYNADLDAYVTMSGRDMDEHLKIDYDSAFTGTEPLEVMAALPDLMRNAVLVETHTDAHKNPDVVAMHRLYAPLKIGDRVYTVKLSVKEFRNGVFSVELPENMRLYHHRIEKEISPVTVTASEGTPADGPRQPGDIDAITVRDILRGVNDNDGVPFNVLEQRAFHGSPHRFMKFMLEHIGSGEGGQAHGWGLYFAQNRETAEGYRKQLTGGHHEYLLVGDRKYWLREGSKEAAWIDEKTGRPAEFYEQDHLTRMYHKAKGATTDQEYLAAVEEWLQDDQYDAEQKEILSRQRDEYLNAQASIEQPGQLYEVDVPENDVLLDEQKTLAEQPEKVKAALEELAKKYNLPFKTELPTIEATASGKTFWIRHPGGWEPAGAPRFRSREKAEAWLRDHGAEYSHKPDGRAIYILLQGKLGSPRAASLALNEAGVKGITYVGGQDGRCFVIFDDQAIDMLDTFYQFIGEEGAARLDEAEEASTRMDNLDVARQMEEAGKDAAAIKLATGWERGADGKWRYEIDDSLIDITGYKARRREELEADPNVKVVADAVWMKSLLEGGASIAEAREAYREKFGREPEQGAGRLSQQTEGAELLKMERQLTSSPSYKLRHFITPEAGRELYAAYPELADMDIELSNEESQNRGAYFPNTDSIVLYDKNLGDYKGMTGTLLHEVQHAIQRREGFASGGNEKTARALASKPLRELLELVGYEAETYTRNAEELAAIEFGLDRIRFAEKPSLFEKTGEYLRVKPFAMPKDKKERASALESLISGWIQERSAEFRSLGHGWWAEYADKQELVERRKKLQAENRKLAQSSKDAARANQLLDKLDEMSDYDIYHSLAGEVEARNTQRRMGMTYEERLASLASSTEDVARKDQIFLQDALGRAMAMGEGARKGVTRGETVPMERSEGLGDVVRLFYHADLSTLLHESSHVFFLQMARLVNSGKASERMKADYQTLCQWAGSTDGYLNTVQHERLARAMELYLREGKAPSKKLESAFARFRRWLTDIYKTVAGNPYFNQDGKQVELNPDVRRVFSRILATQEEVEAQAADDAMGGDWSTRLDRLGMTGAQRIAISGLIQDAKNHAEDELHRLREADKRDRMAKWRKECAQQIEGERVYQARTALRSRKGYGLDMRALANVVGNERALEFFKRLPGVKREGASPWAFAADFGYESVEEFVNEVMAAPTKAERMAELMAAKEQEYDRQFRSDTLLAAEEIAKAQEMIHEHLIKVTGRKERGVPLEEMRRAARDIMATLPIEEATSVGKFRYQAKRLMQAQHEAFMRRDFGKALDITFKLRLNLELTVQAQQNKKEFDSLTKDMVRFTGSKEPNPVVRYAVARLAMKYGMLAPTKMIMRTEGDKDLNVVQGWIDAANEQGYPVEFDAELWTAQLPTWRQMNSATFRRLYAQLVSMMTVERQMRHVDVQGKRMALDQYSQTLGQHMLDNDPNRQNLGFADDKSLVQATKEFLDPLSTVNAKLKMYDSFKPLGMAWRSIMEPINKAEAKQIQFFRKYGPMLQELIKKHYDAKRLVTMKDRQQIPGLKEAVSHEMCIMVGLNMGNAGNRLRLMNGFKNTDTMQDYGEAEVNAMLEQLDENDWRFIQEVWDFFEQFKKESFDMEERLIGVRPLEVEPTPVRTKYGTLRGGYFPIAYDPRRGAKAANQQVGGGKNVMMPSVFHGMMKDRGDQGLGTPLDLRFSVITDKLAETGHNLAYREPVIEVAKLLRSHAVSRAIAATEGPTVELKFWKWLSALAGEKPARNSLDKIASWATSRMAIYSMGFKATTMFSQATGLLATSTQIGWKWTGRGVRDTFNGGNLEKVKEMWQDVCARSPMMQDRMKSFDRDVYTMSHRLFETGHKNAALNLLKKTESWLTEHAFTATGFIQLWMVDIPTWRGAFAKGMEELNMTEEEAALYADDMVVTAQGSGATKDLSDIMREKGFMRLMTMFYSYFNAMYNMFLMQTSKTLRHPKEEWPYLASMAFVLWFVEPVVTGLITGRGPEEDEEWYEWALWNGVKQPFQMIPVLRDLTGAYFNRIEGKFGSDYRFTPAADVIGAFEKTLEHGADLFTSDDYEGRKKAAKRLARDIGMISGTPLLSSQALTTLGNMYDWLDGTEEFALRDLFFTRKK